MRVESENEWEINKETLQSNYLQNIKRKTGCISENTSNGYE